MKATEQKVLRFIKENALIKVNDRILIALSGGPDSIFVLHFFNKFRKKFKIEISAVHVNHLLRGKESDRDEIFCKVVCKELNVPFYSYKKNIKALARKKSLSIELAAREIRYSVFEKIVSSVGIDKIVTAHNSDDNAETVLLNLIKGAGLNGIAGIPVKRDNIIRPILCLNKTEILNYLELHQFEYRIDQSNLTNEFERNFLRNQIIPLIKSKLNPSLDKAILNTSINLQGLIDELKPDKYEIDLKLKKNKIVKIPLTYFASKDRKTSVHLLKNSLDENFEIKLRSTDIRKITSLVNNQTGKSEELSSGLIAQRSRNDILIKPRAENPQKVLRQIKAGEKIKIGNKKLGIEKVNPEDVKLLKDPNIEFISADEIKDIFQVRNWEDGDKFHPIGMEGRKKVSDYLNDIKLDSFEKKNQLVLLNNNKIVWIIGKRLDDRFKVTSSTKKALKVFISNG